MIQQTDYTRRIWTGLTTDDWGDVNLQEGDVIYLMDASQCWVAGENNMYQLPDLGGGGGGSTIVSKTITANGTYYASADSADGYNPVVVNVSTPPPSFTNFVFDLTNSMGVSNQFFSSFYDENAGKIVVYIYATQNTGTTVQKTCLLQNGKVQLGYNVNRTIDAITYNGNPLTYTQSGSSTRRYVEFEVPSPFDPSIPIIFVHN